MYVTGSNVTITTYSINQLLSILLGLRQEAYIKSLPLDNIIIGGALKITYELLLLVGGQQQQRLAMQMYRHFPWEKGSQNRKLIKVRLHIVTDIEIIS